MGRYSIATPEQQHVIDVAFQWYREHGFPHRKLRSYELWQEYYALRNTTLAIQDAQIELFEKERFIEVNGVGMRAADTFHPEMCSARVRDMKTPLDVFNNDKALEKVFRILLVDGDPIDDKSVFNCLQWVNGAQSCKNFRPSAAKALYLNFCSRGARILDPCAGWGGRLLAFIAAGIPESRYWGIDPSVAAMAGNAELAEFYGARHLVTLWTGPFEDAVLTDEFFDFAMTSPPYFCKEEYSHDEGQSFLRYGTYDEWRDGFLAALLRKTFAALRWGGCFCLNIADVTIGKTTYPLEHDTQRMAKAVGFCLTETIQMRFPTMKSFGEKMKTEPVYVLRKE